MELILIRHGQSEHNTKASHSLDSCLTGFGINQAVKLANFLGETDLYGFVGMTSPYLRCLQTAKIIQDKTNLPFEVNAGVREYHIDKTLSPLPKKGGMTLPCRISEFPLFSYEIDDSSVFYANENLGEFVNRVRLFAEELKRRGSNWTKVLIVSHGAPTRVMHDIAIGEDLEYLKDRYNEQELRCEPIEKRGSIQNCSITHVVNGECKVFSGRPYETISRLATNQGSTGGS